MASMENVNKTELDPSFRIHSLVSSPAGHILLSINDHIARFLEGSSEIEVLAGSPSEPGFEDGHSTLSAKFRQPSGMVFFMAQLAICDRYNNRIRILEDDFVYTYAGNAVEGHRDGSKLEASFSQPTSIAVLNDLIYVSEHGKPRIRIISPNGVVSTIKIHDPRCGTTGFTSLTSSDRNLYFCDQANGSALSVSVQHRLKGGQRTLEHTHSRLACIGGGEVIGIASTKNGTLFTVSATSGEVRKVSPNGDNIILVKRSDFTSTIPTQSFQETSLQHQQPSFDRGSSSLPETPHIILSSSGSLFWIEENSSCLFHLPRVVDPQAVAIKVHPNLDSFEGFSNLHSMPSFARERYYYRHPTNPSIQQAVDKCVLDLWIEDVELETLCPCIESCGDWTAFQMIVYFLYGSSQLLHSDMTFKGANHGSPFDFRPTAVHWAQALYGMEQLKWKPLGRDLVDWVYHRLWVQLGTLGASELESTFNAISNYCHQHETMLGMIGEIVRSSGKIQAEILDSIETRDASFIRTILEAPENPIRIIDSLSRLVFPFTLIQEWCVAQIPNLKFQPLDSISLSQYPSATSTDWVIIQKDSKEGVAVHSWVLLSRWPAFYQAILDAPSRVTRVPSTFPLGLLIPMIRYSYTGRVQACQIPMESDLDEPCRYIVSHPALTQDTQKGLFLSWMPFKFHCIMRIASAVTVSNGIEFLRLLDFLDFKSSPSISEVLDFLVLHWDEITSSSSKSTRLRNVSKEVMEEVLQRRDRWLEAE